MADDFKYHIDHHGSLVAPPDLRQSRAAHAAGTIDDDAYRSAVDLAVADAVLRQRRVGMLGLSDGELRRRHDLAVVYDGVEGFGDTVVTSPVAQLVGPTHAAEVRPLVGTPSSAGRLTAHESGPLLASTDRSTMITLPSPGFLAALCGDADEDQAGSALAEIVNREIAALAVDGVRLVLLRNPALGVLVTTDGRDAARALGLDPDKLLARMVELDNAVLAGLPTVDETEFRIGLDITTAGVATGTFDRSAVADLFDRQDHARLCVEHPLEPDRGFPLDLAPQGLVMSLGVVDISAPQVESVDDIVAAIDQASAIIDIDDIAIATNGGFHAVPAATQDVEHDKLQIVEMAARYFWGNEL